MNIEMMIIRRTKATIIRTKNGLKGLIVGAYEDAKHLEGVKNQEVVGLFVEPLYVN